MPGGGKAARKEEPERLTLLPAKNELCGQKRTFSSSPKLFNKVTICVEGNIGSGKTTFLNHFKKMNKIVETKGEPVQLWRDFGGMNLLELFYEDPENWAYPFQLVVLTTLHRRHEAQVKPIRMLERSIFSARYCFSENLKRSGLLSYVDLFLLDQYIDYLMALHNPQVDLIVYLRTTPEKCYERMKARNRPEEQNVSLDYLRQIHDLHEKWLIGEENKSFIRPPVLVVNGDQDKQTIKGDIFEILKQIFERLKQPVNT